MALPVCPPAARATTSHQRRRPRARSATRLTDAGCRCPPVASVGRDACDGRTRQRGSGANRPRSGKRIGPPARDRRRADGHALRQQVLIRVVVDRDRLLGRRAGALELRCSSRTTIRCGRGRCRGSAAARLRHRRQARRRQQAWPLWPSARRRRARLRGARVAASPPGAAARGTRRRRSRRRCPACRCARRTSRAAS